MDKRRFPLIYFLVPILLATLMLAGVACAPDEEPVETITFADLNWDSAMVNTRIAQFIVEHGYGYETDATFGETIPLFMGLRRGDIDVSMEIWIQNQQESYEEGIEAGDVIDLGTNFDDNFQGLFVPTYVIEGDPDRGIEPMAPDLRSVEDLSDYWELFQDPEDPTKGRFYGGVPGWEADKILTEKFETYGLDEYYNIFRPGSGAALAGSLVAAYEQGEPWFGYYWGPTWVIGKLDLTQIDEPEYSDELWEAGYGCHFPAVDVNICVNETLPERAPEVVEFLENYATTSDLLSELLSYQEEQGAEHDEVALYFLQEYEEVWTQWVPEDVAENVRAAL